MRVSPILDRLADLGSAKWALNAAARERIARGEDVIPLTIGNPDIPTPPVMIEAAARAMRAGRTHYSGGQGEPALRAALARRYSRRDGDAVDPSQVICLPGTQTALFTAFMGIGEEGAEILVGDPMYATYEGVIRASGARPVPVPLRPERGFCLDAADLAARITPATRAILLNSPHNPTGAVLTARDLDAIGALASAHDLWIVSDEVYEELVFDGVEFVSPRARPGLAGRTIVVSSISKSHAAPGFRSGWLVGPRDFCARLLPLAEMMLFGNQPFIADMTAEVIESPSPVAPGMRARFAARAARLAERLAASTALRVHAPQAGMFALIDVRATGMDDRTYAFDLLDHGVAVMPGSSFGETLGGWVRVALTVPDDRFDTAMDRIIAHARLRGAAAA
ncbi:arginine:pyruvate transaminase [Albidovulum inexpectatum]|uniref:aspartate transaminase n=1 Tax=Albidovulum inexpectatum TaxID=196587 RepID=A0A2S5JDB1_9RHOB|nr:pyridoxal phosphate-dependent aminotransferase [Albidovulum inexpectatum]PPB79467.1 arginine:pyruvate transaminase [Albidovulum inexpectatum]